ncbi:MAG: tetratricopeptide repeat protein [Saprospiraceae bacterium]
MTHEDELLLEQFFDRTIGPEGRARLDARLAADPDLAAQFHWQKQVAQAFASTEAAAMKARLQAEEQKIGQPLRVAWRNPGRMAAAAAAVLLAVAVAVWFLRPAPQPTDSELFAANFQPFANRFAGERGQPDTRPDSLFQAEMRLALQPYDEKNYAAALAALRRVTAASPEQQAARDFYIAVSLLAERKFDQAAAVLQPISGQPGFYQAPALWHLALAHLGAGREAEAKAALQAYLAHKDGKPERAKADKLLKMLE